MVRANNFTIEQLQNICEKINTLTTKLTGSKIQFFTTISIKLKFDPAELYFHTLISFLYVLYHEDASKNIEFIVKKMNSFGIHMPEKAKENKKLIHAFRTIFQHQMDFQNNKADIEKKNFSENWFQEIVGDNEPKIEEQWKRCVDKILEDSIIFFENLYLTLEQFESNEHLDIIMLEWERVILSSYSLHDFRKILILVLQNLDLHDFLNVEVILQKKIEQWRRELRILSENGDFEKKVYNIVERSVISERFLPINGQDLLTLGLKDKKKIPEILIKAHDSFYQQPCNKEMLIERIRKYLQ